MNTKNLALTAIALATLSLSISPVFAEEAPQPPPEGQREGHDVDKGGPRADKFEKRGREMFEKTDADKDGYLSKEEMAESQRARMEEMFEKTDADKDGKLSPEELKKGRESMRNKFREKYKEHKDGSGSGDDKESGHKSSE